MSGAGGPKRSDAFRSCFHCSQPIVDEYVALIAQREYHTDCTKCSDCGQALGDSCFSWRGKLYCRRDYCTHLSHVCENCNRDFAFDDLTRRIKDKFYHVACVTCVVCGKQLAEGEMLYFDETGRLYCDLHVTARETSIQASPDEERASQSRSPSTSEDGSGFTTDDGGDTTQAAVSFGDFLLRRGPRTSIKPCQYEELRKTFEVIQKPSKQIKDRLAQLTGLKLKVVQVWFQNRRSEVRRFEKLNLGVASRAEGRRLNNGGIAAQQEVRAFMDYRALPEQRKACRNLGKPTRDTSSGLDGSHNVTQAPQREPNGSLRKDRQTSGGFSNPGAL